MTDVPFLRRLPGADPHAKFRRALEALEALGVDPFDLLAYRVFDVARGEVDATDCCGSVEDHIGHMAEDDGDLEEEMYRKAKAFAREAAARAEWESRGD